MLRSRVFGPEQDGSAMVEVPWRGEVEAGINRD